MNATLPNPDEDPLLDLEADESTDLESTDLAEASDSMTGAEAVSTESPTTNLHAPGWVVSPSSPTRPKRPEASLWSKIVPPLLGGVAAIPIALAILWYGFGRDLGNAGPTIARFIPAIVPKHLRGDAFRDDGTFGGGGFRGEGDEQESSEPSPIPPGIATGPSSGLPSLDASPKPNRDSLTADSTLDQAAGRDEPLQPKEPTEPEKSEGDEGPVPTDSAPAESLREAIATCEEIQNRLKSNWSQADNDQRQGMAREFYAACLRLAEKVNSQKSLALVAWRRELDGWSRSFLSEPAYPRLLVLCLEGKIEGLPPHQNGSPVVLVEAIAVPEESMGEWKLPLGLTVGGEPVMLIIPEQVHRRFLSQSLDSAKPTLIIGIWRKMETEPPWIEAVYASW